LLKLSVYFVVVLWNETIVEGETQYRAYLQHGTSIDVWTSHVYHSSESKLTLGSRVKSPSWWANSISACLYQNNAIHILTPSLLKTFLIISSRTSTSSKWHIPFTFSFHNFASIYLCHMYQKSLPVHRPWHCHPKSNGISLQVIKYLKV